MQITMIECMETDKLLVSIVMATYNPRMDWLKEQLVSLNNQSYDTLELLIIDDCSSKVHIEEIRECVKVCITKIPYEIIRNEENLGSTRTFEKLTMLAKGEYIAYCDQDDVWHKEKIKKYLDTIQDSVGALVFSDMNIINAKGEKVASSITQIRKHHKFKSGIGLGETLLFSNFVTGCAMMIRSEEAKKAIPFCPYMVHDHWLALHCALNGEIVFIDGLLIDYRVHEENQTLIMAGVVDKESYVRIRIEEALKRFLWLQERFGGNHELSQTIGQAIEWMEARRVHLRGAGNAAKTIWKYRKFSYLPSMFELIAARFPEKLFMYFIELGRKNIL